MSFLLAALCAAQAQETVERPLVEFADLQVHGDTKAFFTATLPYDHLLMPETATGQGIVDGRLKLDVRGGDLLRFQAHQTVTAWAPGTAGAASLGGIGSTGVGLTSTEAVDLTFDLAPDAHEASTLTAQTRTDRLWLGVSVPHVDLRVGRQPIAFGKGLMFTPMDLVNPFTPATVDSEYRPGVDAFRADVYWGFANQITVAAAYAGSWDLKGTILAAYGQTTLGIWDLGLFGAVVHRDLVAGAAAAGSVGPVALTAEATVTRPPEEAEEDPFVRATAGGLWIPHERLTLSGAVYFQSNGTNDPDDYLKKYLEPRYERGELWAVGRWYAGVTAAFQVNPAVSASLFAIANLEDLSAMVGPGLSWSISDRSDLVLSGYYGFGERPDDLTWEEVLSSGATTEEEFLDQVTVNSEFGLIPALLFAEWKAYF